MYSTSSYDNSNPDLRQPLVAATLLFEDQRNAANPQQLLTITEDEVVKIGRDPCCNTFLVETDADNYVSRNHCEVYIVVYDYKAHHVYVRDQKSFNGTYVNGRLIGNAEHISSGYLLNDGDVVEIRPYWKFTLRQTWTVPVQSLSELQQDEAKCFESRYRISPRSLGHGSEACTHAAVDVISHKQLACKLVDLDKLPANSAKERKRRAMQETDILRQFQHPNILPFVDAICSAHTLLVWISLRWTSADTRSYTFTELAAGGDLLSFINRHGTVCEFDTRIIVRQITRGLRFLHSKGVVHRDLKPENILLACSPHIAYHRVMLSDFGTSTVPYRHRMTTQVGTPHYQAPEVALKHVQTAAIDMWSLGVVALTLLLGQPDWTNDLPLFEQGSTTKYILRQLSRVSDFASKGQDFITSCIKIHSVDRMSSEEADRHPWLTSPESHLQFFNSLDKRMLETWTSQSHIRPLPMQLTDSHVKKIAEKGRCYPITSTEEGFEGSISPRVITSSMELPPPPETPRLNSRQKLQELPPVLLNKGKRRRSGEAQLNPVPCVPSDALLRRAPIRVALCDERPEKRPPGTRKRILQLSIG